MPEQVNETASKKPRFNPESPGPLAELEAEWLRKNKGLEVTAAQVRGILMYHGEFQKSDVRLRQREEEKQAKAQRDAESDERRANRLARLKERARKTAELAEELAKKLEQEQAAEPKANEPAKRTNARGTKAANQSEAGAA